VHRKAYTGRSKKETDTHPVPRREITYL